MVAAGSVVIRDVADFALVVGTRLAGWAGSAGRACPSAAGDAAGTGAARRTGDMYTEADGILREGTA